MLRPLTDPLRLPLPAGHTQLGVALSAEGEGEVWLCAPESDGGRQCAVYRGAECTARLGGHANTVTAVCFALEDVRIKMRNGESENENENSTVLSLFLLSFSSLSPFPHTHTHTHTHTPSPSLLYLSVTLKRERGEREGKEKPDHSLFDRSLSFSFSSPSLSLPPSLSVPSP